MNVVHSPGIRHILDNGSNSPMHSKIRSCVILMALLLLAGCRGLSFGQRPTMPPATLDPALLSVTAPPSLTPMPTYTPPPTAFRLPSETPVPTFPPVITWNPPTPAPTRLATTPPTPTRVVTLRPSATATSFVGIPGVGPEVAELAPILTFSSNAVCGQWFLAQIGVINRGTAGALNFTVQFSYGWGEPQTVFIADLPWFQGPLYLFSGQTAVHCTETSTLTAWIRIDVDNTVVETDEDNNYEEETYTVTFPTATPGQ